MQANTCLAIDVWEGSLELDESKLKDGGVIGMGIRLNDINGGHHLDTNFSNQWAQAINFARFPYFVYNPWVDGPANYAWLAANIPPEAKCIAIDLEVRKSGYSPATYASQFAKFLALTRAKWRTIVYTGEWFLPYLSTWPKDVDYWWAQYPDPNTYFSGVATWEDLKLKLDQFTKPVNSAKIPGTLRMWQFSGDYLVLPGSTRDLDVNIFYGTETDSASYFSGGAINPPIPQPSFPVTVTVTIGSGLNVRSTPSITGARVGYLKYITRVDVLETQPDGANIWGRISTGWIALYFQGVYFTDWKKA